MTVDHDDAEITLPEIASSVFAVQNGANNSVIEFLSGSTSATNTAGRNIFLLGSADNTKTTLIFGGSALLVGPNPGDHRAYMLNGISVNRSTFFDDDTNADSEVILLPGALINGKRSRPFSGVYSRLGASGFDNETDRLKIGNFHAGIPPRTGWVHAGQWDFGYHRASPNAGINELIVDTNPGVRFSVGNGVNHHRHDDHELNALYGVNEMRIKSGNVVLGGSVYMPHGKVYIHDAGRLTFEIGKRRDADGTDHPRPRTYPDRIGEMIISRLTADQVIFTGDDPKVFIQFAHYLTRNDLQKFWGQLSFTNLTQIDNVRKSRTQNAGDEGDGSALSQIFKVNDVFYNTNVNLLSRHNIVLKVFSDGPSGTQQVGSITFKEHLSLTTL